jgi:hypothetical protein
LEKSDSGYRAELKQEPINQFHTALKVVSYMAFFINRLSSTLFPRLQTHHGVRQFQTIVNCIPLVMLATKIALRTGLRFYTQDQPQPATHNANASVWSSQYEKVITTLDDLFGGEGFLDRIPSLDDRIGENPITPSEMSAPIMKGLQTFQGRSKAFVAIRMRCLSNDASNQLQLVFLYQYSDEPLRWEQLGSSSDPVFFDGNFTYAEDGKVTPSQTDNFALLKTLIANREGVDKNGNQWKIE